MIEMDTIDHLVLTVADVTRTVAFYTDVLGMRPMRFGDGRVALRFGRQKINLHQVGEEIEPAATHPTPGSADLCFISRSALAFVLEHLRHRGIPVVEGPVARTGAVGQIQSLYIRDPDGNLVEISTYG
jgi:catechol 2,3-dioxygenase-like lactoylglutathione lyase family enzyme